MQSMHVFRHLLRFTASQNIVNEPHFTFLVYSLGFFLSVELGVHEVLKEITASDCIGFYQHVGHLNL